MKTISAAERNHAVAVETDSLKVAACLFHGFSDPSRLAIVRHLALGEHRVVDLTAHLGLAQCTVSKHLACLGLRSWCVAPRRDAPRCSRLTHPEATHEPAGCR